jgi:hypothetical protein
VATALLVLRHRRANHKHVTRAAIRLLTEHPQAPELLCTHRRVLVAGAERALGKATARGAARAVLDGAAGPDLHRTVLRFGRDDAVSVARIRALYAGDAAPAPAVPPPFDLDIDAARPDTSPRPTAVTSPPPSCTCTGAARPQTSPWRWTGMWTRQPTGFRRIRHARARA